MQKQASVQPAKHQELDRKERAERAENEACRKVNGRVPMLKKRVRKI